LLDSVPHIVWWLTGLAYYALSLWAVALVLRQRLEPSVMLLWVLGLLFLTPVGVPLYFLFGERRIRRRARKKRMRAAPIVKAIASAEAREHVRDELPASHPFLEAGFRQLAEISTQLGSLPLTTGNNVDVFTTAQSTYEDLLHAIDGASRHIHLEYYIFRPDDTGHMFLKRLTAKAREGVEVRLLLDGIGSWKTSKRFLRPLLDAGGRVETFLPAIPWRQPWNINFRNHRKILIVDGRVAYTGSQNIGDEYRGRLRRVGPWKDTHLRLEGSAAQRLQEVFIEDWFFASREDLTSSAYLSRQPQAGTCLAQILATGPDQAGKILSHIFFAALSLAQKHIFISTPYFVPDPGLILALQNAAYRGVRVDILIPSKTDNRLVLWAGRSFYQELVRAGVNIYEFDHGMLHAKTVSIDDQWSLISSANMDRRSFFLNFEVTVSVFDQNVSKRLIEEFGEDRARSVRIEPIQGSGPWVRSVLEGAARLLSPVL
jgi:cardiolipin synthase